MADKQFFLEKFHRWRNKNLSTKAFITILSIVVGIAAGFAAVIIKNAVKFIQNIPGFLLSQELNHYLYFVYPFIGIALVYIFVHYILKKPVRHGIPNVLYGISQRKGYLGKHNLFSSVITSAFTVGFGGSVGLEGPTVATGAAIGSQLSKFLRLEYKYVVLLLACACTGAMAAIFKAPIAAIVFAIEVIMIDLTTFSLIPLMLASASAVLTSYLFLGMNVLYPFEVQTTFELNELPFYIVLGLVAGLVSVYFTKMYIAIEKIFSKIRKKNMRMIIGGLALGVLLFIFPSLYGEGYEAINSGLQGKLHYLFENSIFSDFEGNFYITLVLLALIILFKVVATSATFGAGGVGGIFAPTLFTGVNIGLLFALFTRDILGFDIFVNNYALIGMGGLIAGVLHAPLTGIFLIADISGGYKLFVPLMVTASFSYIVTKAFTKNSVYTLQLAQRKQLVTHHKDKHVLSIMNAYNLIEKDFVVLNANDTLRQLVDAISVSHRNLFPITDDDGYMVGMLKMDDVRHLIFKQDQYDKIKLKDLMYMPEHWISPNDSMEEVVKKFESSGRYNLAVMDNGKYLGFISRAKVFSKYRKYVEEFSHD